VNPFFLGKEDESWPTLTPVMTVRPILGLFSTAEAAGIAAGIKDCAAGMETTGTLCAIVIRICEHTKKGHGARARADGPVQVASTTRLETCSESDRARLPGPGCGRTQAAARAARPGRGPRPPRAGGRLGRQAPGRRVGPGPQSAVSDAGSP
jgi:hypothetical protein